MVWFDLAAALADPRALDRLDGSPELSRNVSSILWGLELPALAIDPARRRFAVAADNAIHVVEILA